VLPQLYPRLPRLHRLRTRWRSFILNGADGRLGEVRKSRLTIFIARTEKGFDSVEETLSRGDLTTVRAEWIVLDLAETVVRGLGIIILRGPQFFLSRSSG
jgi:hypothetical protein